MPQSSRREISQRANNMPGRNRRTRMRKPFHYPSNCSLHAPAHTPPIHTHRARYSELMTVISFDKGYHVPCTGYREPALVPDAHPKPTSLSEILLQTNVNTIVNLTSAICAPLAAPGLTRHPMPPCLHCPSLLSLFRCCRCGGYVIGPQLNYHISNE